MCTAAASGPSSGAWLMLGYLWPVVVVVFPLRLVYSVGFSLLRVF